MTEHESPVETLVRSAFGFVLLFFLSALVTWVALLLSPISPDANFAQLRTMIIIVAGIGVLALLVLCVWLLRVDLTKLSPMGKIFGAIFGNIRVAVFVIFILIEINFIAGVALINVAPPFVQPGRFLLASWSLIFVLMLGVIHWQTVRDGLRQTQTLWATMGLMIIGFVVVAMLYLVTSQLVNASGINNQLRGGLDYRPLSFVDDGQQPATAEQFWLEQADAQVRWSPYTYWVGTEVTGQYVNVSNEGIRHTPQVLDQSNARGQIFVFGGSTVWGEGARDLYTIPARLATQLQANDIPYYVTNYGQTGYVSSQDMILFQLQLLRGNAPDIAIFYGGFNDTLAAYGEALVGVTLQESQRLRDSEAGRQLRQGQPLLTPLSLPLSTYDYTLAATTALSAQAVADRWFANVAMIEAIAQSYGVMPVFVWQPHIMGKNVYTDEEQSILTQLDDERPGFIDLYRAVDGIVRERVQAENYTHIIVLSELFAGDERTIFHDLVHITELGNQLVAEAILPQLETHLLSE